MSQVMDDGHQAETPAEDVTLMDPTSSKAEVRSFAGVGGRKLILTFLGSALLGFVAVSANSSRRQGALEATTGVVGKKLQLLEETGKCIWTEYPQYDYPERADVQQVDMAAKNWTDVQEVQKVVEDDGSFSGFAIRDGIAFLKSSGPTGPKSPDDLIWMGNTYKVVFHLCQRPEQLRAIEEERKSTAMLVGEMLEKEFASIEGNWVVVDGLPINEGEGIEIVNSESATTTTDMRVMCYDDPGCVAFAYFPEYKVWFAKRKGTGFSSATARYHRKKGEEWEWHYLKSRAGPSGGPEDEADSKGPETLRFLKTDIQDPDEARFLERQRRE